MAIAYNSKIVTDGLVFAYDMSNRSKSWRGAPTTNFVSNPLNFLNTGVWGRTAITVAAATAPDGSNTAALIQNTNVVTSLIDQTIPVSTTGTGAIRCSVWARVGSTNSFTLNCYYVGDTEINVTFNLLTDQISGGTGLIEDQGDGWKRCSITVPARVSAATSFAWRIWPSGRAVQNSLGCIFWRPQAETSSFTTPFVEGTRANTQAVVDLVGNNTVTANSLTYNSDNTFNFNGSSNYLSIANSAAIRPASELTVECVIRPTTTPTSWSQLIGYGQADYTNGNYLLFLETNSTLCRALARVNNIEYRCNTSYTAPLNQYTHIAFTMKTGDAIRSYFNSVADITTVLPAGTFTYNGTASAYQIGSPGGSWYPGQIPSMKIYNRALSASEIAQNFDAIRSRYGV